MTEALCCEFTKAPFSLSQVELSLRDKLTLPLPCLCPEERLRQLMSFSNLTNLFAGNCSASGKKLLQLYPPNSPFPVYDVPYWWSDEWDPCSYARNYNFEQTFFAQFSSLICSVPVPALTVEFSSIENSDFSNGVSHVKNCYLCFNSAHCEDCYYCVSLWSSRDCIDCSSCQNCELCYDCTMCSNCYELRHSFNSQNCRQSAFLWNCLNCQDCCFSVNLSNTRFCFMNEQLSEREYREKIKSIAWDDYLVLRRLKEEFRQHVRRHPQPNIRGVENSACSGDFLQHCITAENCFDCSELRDCVNCYGIYTANDCLDYYSWGSQAELIYGSARVGYSCKNIICSHRVLLGCENVEYSINCSNCKDCFGCASLRGKQYCILNQQYSKDEYFALRARIIAQMNTHGGRQAYGNLLPYNVSHHPYNFSDAMLYFPLGKSEALKRGAIWYEEPEQEMNASFSWENVPEKTSELSEEILKESFSCLKSSKVFRFTKRELQAYKVRNIPLPREHWRERLLERIALLNPATLHERICPKTSHKLSSTFSPEENWMVWDQEAYLKEFRS